MPDAALVYLSLGSNLGDRAVNTKRAIEAMPAAGIRVLRVSSLYETEPVDFLAQPWFLNCVVEAETSLAPLPLLEAFHRIARDIGPEKQIPSGPRVIDIDILFYGTEVIRSPELEIPHPRMSQRRFVLVPLAEIAPNIRHPVLDATISELLAATLDKCGVRIWRAPSVSPSHD